VPTIVQKSDDRAVFESILCIEYVDELARSIGADSGIVEGTTWLLPDDLVQRAHARSWSERVNRTLCSPYYTILVRSEPAERRAGYDLLIKGLERFSAELEKTAANGPYFFGASPSIVDFTLVPWAFRYYVFETCRGPEYAIPRGSPALAAYWRWYDAIMALPAVAKTLPDKTVSNARQNIQQCVYVFTGCRGSQRYLDHIQKYADGSARSKVGNAVRRGVAAHEFDDIIDDHGSEERPKPVAESS
jgi:glutathione S-transferase